MAQGGHVNLQCTTVVLLESNFLWGWEDHVEQGKGEGAGIWGFGVIFFSFDFFDIFYFSLEREDCFRPTPLQALHIAIILD